MSIPSPKPAAAVEPGWTVEIGSSDAFPDAEEGTARLYWRDELVCTLATDWALALQQHLSMGDHLAQLALSGARPRYMMVSGLRYWPEVCSGPTETYDGVKCHANEDCPGHSLDACPVCGEVSEHTHPFSAYLDVVRRG